MLSANLSLLGPNAPASLSQPSCASARRQSALRPDLHTPTTSADLHRESAAMNESAADLFYSPDAPMTGLAAAALSSSTRNSPRSVFGHASSSAALGTPHHQPAAAAAATQRTLTPVDRFGSPLPSRAASNAATDSDEKPIAPPAIVAHAHGYEQQPHASVAHTLMAHHHLQHSPRRSAAAGGGSRAGGGGGGHSHSSSRRQGNDNNNNNNNNNKDTRVKLTNDALASMAAISDVLLSSTSTSTSTSTTITTEEQRAVRKYAKQVLGHGTNEETDQQVAMAAEAASMIAVVGDESSAGRMWDQSGASAYETDYGRDFD